MRLSQKTESLGSKLKGDDLKKLSGIITMNERLPVFAISTLVVIMIHYIKWHYGV